MEECLQKAGFEAMSADFIEAWIPHVQMRRNLAARSISIS